MALSAAVMLPACALLGVEPDEIDVATDAGETTGQGDGDGDPATGGDGDPSSTGDGDPSTGDGDGDPTGNEGDGDPTGDGDGDGDEAGVPCGDFVAGDLSLGDNPVDVLDGPSIVDGSCGSDGPDAIYEFIGPVSGEYTFTLTNADFTGALYLAGEVCDPVEELACELEDLGIQYVLDAEDKIYVIVDADTHGQAVVSISGP